MTNTDILLEDLEDVLDDATSMPMTKKSLVDVEKIKTIIEDIRLNTPHETKQAKAIIDSRNTILDDANKMPRLLLPMLRQRLVSLLHVIRLHRLHRLRQPKCLQEQKKRVRQVSARHRLVQVRF